MDVIGEINRASAGSGGNVERQRYRELFERSRILNHEHRGIERFFTSCRVGLAVTFTLWLLHRSPCCCALRRVLLGGGSIDRSRYESLGRGFAFVAGADDPGAIWYNLRALLVWARSCWRRDVHELPRGLHAGARRSEHVTNNTATCRCLRCQCRSPMLR